MPLVTVIFFLFFVKYHLKANRSGTRSCPPPRSYTEHVKPQNVQIAWNEAQTSESGSPAKSQVIIQHVYTHYVDSRLWRARRRLFWRKEDLTETLGLSRITTHSGERERSLWLLSSHKRWGYQAADTERIWRRRAAIHDESPWIRGRSYLTSGSERESFKPNTQERHTPCKDPKQLSFVSDLPLSHISCRVVYWCNCDSCNKTLFYGNRNQPNVLTGTHKRNHNHSAIKVSVSTRLEVRTVADDLFGSSPLLDDRERFPRELLGIECRWFHFFSCVCAKLK